MKEAVGLEWTRDVDGRTRKQLISRSVSGRLERPQLSFVIGRYQARSLHHAAEVATAHARGANLPRESRLPRRLTGG